jgi:hypothetical protein
MPKLSEKLKRRIVIAVTSEQYGKELIDAIENIEGSGEVLNGTGAPSNTLGDNGDLYINLTNGDLYKKINDVWVLHQDGATAAQAALEDIEQPVGLKDPSQVALSVDDSSRTLTVSPVSGSYVYFVSGKRIEISTSKTATWPNTHGINYFYLDENSNLVRTGTFVDEIITRYTFVSIVYWDQLAAKHIYFANERHGIKMSPVTHAYLHRTRGAAFDNGCKLVNFVVDGAGSSNTHAQFNSNSGVIWDEDIRISLPAQTTFPVFYRDGVTNWKRKNANSLPMIVSGEEGYTGAGGRVAYNLLSGGNWSLAEVDNNKFVLLHVFATNDIDHPFIVILGQAQYNSKADARTGAISEIKGLSGLPVLEFCPIGSVIVETSNSYTNTPKARIVSTASGADYEDHRSESIRPGSLA